MCVPLCLDKVDARTHATERVLLAINHTIKLRLQCKHMRRRTCTIEGITIALQAPLKPLNACTYVQKVRNIATKH